MKLNICASKTYLSCCYNNINTAPTAILAAGAASLGGWNGQGITLTR